MKDTVSFESASRYAAKFGRKETLKRLAMLGKLQNFRNMLNTPIGSELLKDIDDSIRMLNEKVVLTDDSTPEDKALLRAYIIIGQRWAERIAALDSLNEQFSGAE